MNSLRNKLRNRTVGILNEGDAFCSSVLLPLEEQDGKLSLLFEVRSKNLKGQPGEICFPGGRIEKDDGSPLRAAVRETSEELGIDEKDIQVLGQLDILCTPHSLIIYPFVGKLKEDITLNPEKGEVAEIFRVPLDYLLEVQPTIKKVRSKLFPEGDFPFELIPGGKDYPWREGKYPVYFYFYEDYIIWGLTARILHHFLENIR